MGALGQLLIKLFGHNAQGRYSLLTSSSGVSILAATAMSAVVFGAYTAINSLVDGLAVVMPSELTLAASWVVPTNADECITAIISAHVIKSVMDYKAKMIEMQSNASLIT